MFRLKGCPRCAGDLQQDNQDWRCLQCGREYFPPIAIYLGGREGAWGNKSSALPRKAGKSTRRRTNKSGEKVASV